MSPAAHPHVILAGVAMVVPLPILDDWLSRKALRRALQADAEACGQPLDEATLDVLTEDRSNMLVGCLRAAIFWPVKKLFRTVLWFLTVKDVIDIAARSAEVVAMARIARERGWLPGRASDVRDAMEVSFGRHRWSPVTRFIMRYPRPPLGEPADEGALGGLLQGLRKQAGAVPMEEMFVERVRASVAGELATALESPSPG
ncbi:MAG: hypothetical protein FJ102_22365 [Deltaproteobacteria bacterium]|nr:hypothetical protein [Deltaproteobacteria bacterium]